MKALVAYAPGSIGLVERPMAVPAPDEVLVTVAYANICHTDHFIVEGSHPTARHPVVPGHEFSGVITGVGTEVDPARLGERVTAQTQLGCRKCEACRNGRVGWCDVVGELGSTLDGGWQESLTVPSDAAILLPASLSLLEGSLTEPSANAYAAVEAADIQPTDTVVVVGPGPIGLLVIQHAALRHPRALVLVGLETDSTRLKLGRRLGATTIVGTVPSEARAAVLEATSGKGGDVVIQCAGSIAASAMALQIVAERGRIVIEGYAASSETIEVSPDQLAVRELTIQGVRGWTESQFRATLSLHEAGAIQVKSLVTDFFLLADFERAMARSLDYAGGVVKVCFAIGGGLHAHA